MRIPSHNPLRQLAPARLDPAVPRGPPPSRRAEEVNVPLLPGGRRSRGMEEAAPLLRGLCRPVDHRSRRQEAATGWIEHGGARARWIQEW
jgi:hypothetical protein